MSVQPTLAGRQRGWVDDRWSVLEEVERSNGAEGANARGQTHEDLPPGAACGEPGQLTRVSSTRRFCERPSAVLFDAIGLLGPKP